MLETRLLLRRDMDDKEEKKDARKPRWNYQMLRVQWPTTTPGKKILIQKLYWVSVVPPAGPRRWFNTLTPSRAVPRHGSGWMGNGDFTTCWVDEVLGGDFGTRPQPRPPKLACTAQMGPLPWHVHGSYA